MWSQLFKVASMSKGALVVGVAASAALVSNAEFSNTPSQQELASASPSVSVAPATPTAPRLADSPSASPRLDASSDSATPSAAALQHGAVPEIFKECAERYLAVREAGDSAQLADRQAAGEVCKAALAQSGLSGSEFWAKFGPHAHAIAPETETPKADHLEALVKECVAQRQAGTADQSDACRSAIAASGLTPQGFWTKFSKHLGTTDHDLTPNVQSWIKECVTKYTRQAADATETCKKAIQLTGLTSGQFAEQYLKEIGTKPATSPSAKPTATFKPVTKAAELSQLVARCFDLYKTITSTSGDTKAASEACRVAIQASGMSSTDFWAKYHPTTATN